MRKLLLLSFLLGSWSVLGQTWSDDVAEIFYEKCTKCHHTGGAGGFPLMTYAQASGSSAMIGPAIVSNQMPPWPPNNDYQTYTHDRSLSDVEKTTVLDWILNGTQEGNPANTPPPPVYTTGAVLGNGDLELQIPTYMSKATATSDDYVCFAMPSNLPADRKIKAIEIVPGNPEIVHHCLVYIDPTSSCVTDTVGGDCGGPSSQNATLAMGYTPGSSPMTLPSVNPLKLGMTMPANSQVVFAMHYPEGSYGEYDSTKVIFHFYPPGETGVREVYATPVLQNWNFMLPPNQFTDVSAQYPASGGLTFDASLLSVFPHMHLLGNDMQVFGIDPMNDTLKLIDIPHWDFEWQDFYFYEYVQHAPSGTTLYAEGTFDNTTANTHNPNNPPITVYPGLNTADEMFLVYMHYMLYQNGDENINLDSLMNLSTNSIIEEQFEVNHLRLFPNPFTDEVTIYADGIAPGDQVSIYVYDANGSILRRLMNNETIQTEEISVIWDGNNDEGTATSNGLYFVSINVNGNFSHQRLVKQ